jgi:hypothetical protein
LIDSSAKKMADEFFAAFDYALTGGSLPELVQAALSPGVSAPGPAVTGQPGGHAPFTGGGFGPELYRVFWFSLGVAFTLGLSHWLR